MFSGYELEMDRKDDINIYTPSFLSIQKRWRVHWHQQVIKRQRQDLATQVILRQKKRKKKELINPEIEN